MPSNSLRRQPSDPVRLNVNNFPSVQVVSFDGTQNVDIPGGVNVNNFPTTQDVTGLVEISEQNLDAFNRLQVSEGVPRLENQFTYDLAPLIYGQVISGTNATITHDTVNRCALCSLSASASGSEAYMQSFESAYYLPGNSHLTYWTMGDMGHEVGVFKFIAYGDIKDNAIAFFSDGTQYGWRIYSGTDLGQQTKYQSEWILDKLDGTGPSGKVLDGTKVQIGILDLQALYTGRVRVGFNIDGQKIWCHEFDHANKVAFAYIQTATLPVSGGIIATTAGATGSMRLYCSTVKSEGSSDNPVGYEFTVKNNINAADGVMTHALTIRPKLTFNGIRNRVIFKVVNITVRVIGTSPVDWELRVGQPITGGTFNSVNDHSAFEYNSGATLNGTPTIVPYSDGVAASNQARGSSQSSIENKYSISLDVDGSHRNDGSLTLAVAGVGAASAVRVSINFREIR